jgi:hypothetical protein
MALTVYEVVKGIYAAIHNKHHGAIDEDGKLVEIGLKREDQPIKDQKVMDGFGIALHGNILMVKYHSVEPLANLHEKRFDREVEARIHDITKHIQKEFSKHTGASLRLKEVGDPKILVETGNRIKVMVKAQMAFEVLNLKDLAVIGAPSDAAKQKIAEIEKYNKSLTKGKTKPTNVTRPK